MTAKKTLSAAAVFDRENFEDILPRGRKLVLPITLTLVGIGAISVAFLLASRPDYKTSSAAGYEDDNSYDVENYDVVTNKPFIYSICE